MAIPRSDGSNPPTSRPPISNRPPVCISRPEMMRSSVDFPQPEGPTKTQNSPASTVRSMPLITSTAPKLLRMPDRTTLDMAYPFTAPAVMPATIWRLKKMNTISGGIVTSRMFMNSRLNCDRNWLWKL